MKKRLSDKPEEISLHILVVRLLALEFAAIHTSTVDADNAIFNLVSAASHTHHLKELWDEGASVLADDEGVWTLG
jgi:hypothetical protein